ncbi:MAG: hypothetical protein RLY16_1801 [Bacteroidota bacterium]|jgi:4-hydroxybenzoate polyprenyltransferase
MKLIIAFLRLIRWPNLIFIALTQSLFYYCIIQPALQPSYFALEDALTSSLVGWLIGASICIAAGGYIINDYFDINIDQVNKPAKMVVDKIIYRRYAILWHIFLTLAGLAASFYVAMHSSWFVFIANVVCAVFLWFYSTTFKRRLLSGNLITSALTAWTILVLYFAVNVSFWRPGSMTPDLALAMQKIFKFAILYAGFAFIVSLIREVIKDMEDVEGDRRYHCQTMPIAWGMQTAKVFAAVWLVVLIGALIILQFYAWQLGWWWSALYILIILVIPLCKLLWQLKLALYKKDYSELSKWIKLIMLAGILSMAVIYFSTKGFNV